MIDIAGSVTLLALRESSLPSPCLEKINILLPGDQESLQQN